MKQLLIVFAIAFFGFAIMPKAVAEDDAGVAGCASIHVDPSASLEFQQNICNAGENDSSTSCAASGNGRCSSPKYNDVMPDADHCLCVDESESTEEAVS